MLHTQEKVIMGMALGEHDWAQIYLLLIGTYFLEIIINRSSKVLEGILASDFNQFFFGKWPVFEPELKYPIRLAQAEFQAPKSEFSFRQTYHC